MMLMQYAVQGSWMALAGKYFADPPPHGLGLSGAFVGTLFALMPLGSILSPLLIGQLADKHVRAERLQGIICLISGLVLLAISTVRTAEPLFWLMLVYSLLWAPTTTLTNAIAFTHLDQPQRDFGKVRVGGTLGFFVALCLLAGWRRLSPAPITGDIFMQAGVITLVFAVYSLWLPKTPPLHTGKTLPFIDALSLFKNRNFVIFSILGVLLASCLDFYYIFAAAYIGAPHPLGGVGVSADNVPLIMMLPQTSELVVMSTLGASLPRLGVKRAFSIGFIAWAVRFFFFAVSPTVGFAAAGLLMHGLCFTFVFAVASLYVNDVAPPSIRASAQALVTIGLFGFGRLIGSQVAGIVQGALTHPLATPTVVNGTTYTKETQWQLLFAIPTAVTLGIAIAFMLLFRADHHAAAPRMATSE